MACLFPYVLPVKAYDPSSRYYFKGHKNSSYSIKADCGHCVNCLEKKVRQWTYRLMAQTRSKNYDKMAFITLTYDDEHLPENGSCCIADVQKFMKRIRRYYDYHGGKNEIKYYGCTEYGGEKGRCHAHLLILGLDYNDLLPIKPKLASHNTKNCTSPFWKKGLLNYGTDVSLQDSRLIRYVTKYIDKLDTENLYKFCDLMEIERPKVYKSLGIGADYLQECCDEQGKLPRLGGLTVNLPPYWRKKLGCDNLFDFKEIINMKNENNLEREKLMRGMENTDENYAEVVTRCKKGV